MNQTTVARDETRRPMVERVIAPEPDVAMPAPPSITLEMVGRIETILGRVNHLTDVVNNLADRALGERPELTRSDAAVKGCGFGGQFAELFYTISSLEGAMDRLESETGRLRTIA